MSSQRSMGGEGEDPLLVMPTASKKGRTHGSSWSLCG